MPADHERSNDLIEDQLNGRLKRIEEVMGHDVFVFKAPLLFGAENRARDAIEAISGRRSRLSVLVETGGGYIEVTQRIVDVLRKHYAHVEFIVPNYAMSAGTVLVMSGDAIHMDYFSILGPIDPQSQRPGSDRFVPALGYLEWYQRLLDKSKADQLSDAELSFLLDKFDPAELYQFEQERELSITLLRDWLAKYKFKDWTVTETKKAAVTNQMREQRAAEIANQLQETGRWHSHGRGISMEVLRRELNLRINDFGGNPDLNKAIRSYWRLFMDYLLVRRFEGAIQTREEFQPI